MIDSQMPVGGPAGDAINAAVRRACARIAPAWPLDRMIAVNPWWGFVEHSMEDAAAELAALAGTHLTMPREWFRARWRQGAFTEADVRRVMGDSAWSQLQVGEVTAALTAPTATVPRMLLMTDVADAGRDLQNEERWNGFVVSQISRTCAAYFDNGQSTWAAPRANGLYALWHRLASGDNAPWLLMRARGIRGTLATLPNDPMELIVRALDELGIAEHHCERYCSALLLSVNGWASVCAFRRWEAELAAASDDHIVHLLAIRMAWEVMLHRSCGNEAVERWMSARDAWPTRPAECPDAAMTWCLQRALESAYQTALVRQLTSTPPMSAPAPFTPHAQVVFCIDVRSEPFRRALEATAGTVQTLGFAGFFGAPIAYVPPTGLPRPQLPGLLAPALLAEDVGTNRDKHVGAARRAQRVAAVKFDLAQQAISAFPYIEMTGAFALVSLLRRTLRLGESLSGQQCETRPRGQAGLVPRIARRCDGEPVETAARVALAAGLLRGLSLTRDFAPLLVLVGHASQTQNNPQAAALACGACGGQSGEVNARVMAALLNETLVRDGLRTLGIDLPDTTLVVAGVHDTTTDEIRLFDTDPASASHGNALVELQRQLLESGHQVRRGRAPFLGIPHTERIPLLAAVRARATDWSEPRPEWGLARNAAFIVAPRARTLGLDLDGRVFLHEYRHRGDENYAVLESIMTAPMLVTHWINLQYYASTVDPVRHGSGDKTLHNVVGANVGVFEGASGDLRTGLALQSVHDGTDWYHEPLRLSVFIEAPAHAIDAVINKHAVVRDLVHGEWLHLFRIDDENGTVWQWRPSGWQARR